MFATHSEKADSQAAHEKQLRLFRAITIAGYGVPALLIVALIERPFLLGQVIGYALGGWMVFSAVCAAISAAIFLLRLFFGGLVAFVGFSAALCLLFGALAR
jgi:pheromone shutdown protein TraB